MGSTAPDLLLLTDTNTALNTVHFMGKLFATSNHPLQTQFTPHYNQAGKITQK